MTPSSSSEAQREAEGGEEALEAQRNRGIGEHGCKHYRRRVRFITPCCDEEWWCRHCHNEVKYQQEEDWQRKHELDRKQITDVVCALCATRQPVGDHCVACNTAFGAYACTACPFFDDDLSKQPFHCDDCGICRIGGRSNYFHCPTCGSCYSTNLRGNHKCVERAMHQNCPVCFEFLFESVDPTTVLRCGHTIHTQCLKDLEKTSSGVCPMCPICKRSLGDYSRYWAAIDRQVAASRVPAEYRGWRADILCNDCSNTSNVAFHIIGLRCPGCGSYNTRRMGVQTSDGGGDADADAATADLDLGGAGEVAQHLMDALLGMAPGVLGAGFGDVEGEFEEDDGGDWEEGEEEESDGDEGDAAALAEAEALAAGAQAFAALNGGGGGPLAEPIAGLVGGAAAAAPPPAALAAAEGGGAAAAAAAAAAAEQPEGAAP